VYWRPIAYGEYWKEAASEEILQNCVNSKKPVKIQNKKEA
jgi:hypothetical protein